ncbi:hypothetical protein CgunFtcFv8_014951 [Champsocephalus gunnari]|uniref:Uncharacterized protein n=1 Tax=Champsocephalus gunnari TaxID=52237 RepID=A0AAN8E3Q7_CHAGU|nr:hypothetical protein CgunFtcFv8_014951 [Champsocephalus gunnari]
MTDGGKLPQSALYSVCTLWLTAESEPSKHKQKKVSVTDKGNQEEEDYGGKWDRVLVRLMSSSPMTAVDSNGAKSRQETKEATG